MAKPAVVLVEPSQAGNLGAVLRVAANFGVERVELVRPAIEPEHPDVRQWACGGDQRVAVGRWGSLAHATAGYRTLLGTASQRGRPNQPCVDLPEAADHLADRGIASSAIVFGNETSGLRRDQLDRCDLLVRIPTVTEFPVLNLAQSVAIMVAYLAVGARVPAGARCPPASQEAVHGMMEHLRRSLLAIGFLDPLSPDRILRKLRRLFGRAGITDNEVAILRGICRQMEWAARTGGPRDPITTDGEPW